MEKYYTAVHRKQGFQLIKNFFCVALKAFERGEYVFNKEFFEKNYSDLSVDMAISPEGVHEQLKIFAKDICASFTTMGYNKTSYSTEGGLIIHVKW